MFHALDCILESDDGEINNRDQQEDNTGMKKFGELELDVRLMIWLTGGIFVMAAVTAFILIRQANVMQGQLDEMKSGGDQTDRVIMLNMGQLTNAAKMALAAKQQADAAQGSVKAIQTQMRQDQRPWMGVIENGQLVVNDKGVSFPIRFGTTQGSKTPARDVRAMFILKPVLNRKPLNLKPWYQLRGPADAQLAGIMFPSQATDLTVKYRDPKTAKAIPLSIEQTRQLTQGESFIVIYGAVRYRDTFGNQHWTQFCDWKFVKAIPEGYTASDCTEYNNTDDNQ